MPALHRLWFSGLTIVHWFVPKSYFSTSSTASNPLKPPIAYMTLLIKVAHNWLLHHTRSQSVSRHIGQTKSARFSADKFFFWPTCGPVNIFLSVDIDLHCLCRRQPTLVSQQVGTICQPMISLPANTTINSAIADKPLDYMQCHGWSPKTRSSHTCYMLTSVVVK